MSNSEYVLTLNCHNTVGIVHAVSGFLVRNNCDILESTQFDDQESDVFFMRIHFSVQDESSNYAALQSDFETVALQFGMEWQLYDKSIKQRVLIMVSKYDHCLHDLLYRYKNGTLNIEIPLVVSNHPDAKELVDFYGIPFLHLPVTPETKMAQEAKLMEQVSALDIDLVVLARYMQILSADLCDKLQGRAINIHHSFLPGFKGARPYHQAYERGVKLIGATAHYVTSDLDEGPIIEQRVERVRHSCGPKVLSEIGQECEKIALMVAIFNHTEHRIITYNHRTIVF